jgi:cell division ATPase FtsA
VALVDFGAEVTTVSVHAGGMLLGMQVLPFGSGDITDAVASAFGIRRYQAERLKCMSGSAIASPADHREMIPVNAPGDPEGAGPVARHADDKNRIPRAELISVITQQLGHFTDELGRCLKAMGFTGTRGQQVVLTGGGATAGPGRLCPVRAGAPGADRAPPAMLGLPQACHAQFLHACRAGTPCRVRSGRHPQADHGRAGAGRNHAVGPGAADRPRAQGVFLTVMAPIPAFRRKKKPDRRISAINRPSILWKSPDRL